jgi:aspartate/methionine/tyrosine aminotransferase
MSFDQNEYLSWYMPRVRSHDGSINLHSSGVVALDPRELDIAFGDPWTAVSRFEAGLATWLGLSQEEVVYTPGGTSGTLLALLTLAEPGSHLVVERPIYEPMLRQAERLGHTDRLTRRLESQWRLPLEDAEELITDETSVVMITEPHNPSGCFAPSQDVIELAALCGHHGASLIINEVYRGFCDRPSYHGMAENIVVVSSLSKLFGAYWARLGWLSAPTPVTKKLRLAHMTMGMPAAPNAEVGLAILARADALRQRAIEASSAGRAMVQELVARTPCLSWQPPQGPGYGCVQLPDGADDVAFAELLHKRDGVLLVPGSFFDAPGTLRLSWLQSGAALEAGLELLGRALDRDLC